MDGYKCWVLVCARCVLPFALGLTPMLVRAEWRRAFALGLVLSALLARFPLARFAFPVLGLARGAHKIAQNALGLTKVSARLAFPVLGPNVTQRPRSRTHDMTARTHDMAAIHDKKAAILAESLICSHVSVCL